jgi:hypothetical protein
MTEHLATSEELTNTADGRAGITRRSLILGLALTIVLGIGAPYVRNVLPSSLFDGEYLPFGVVWPIAMLVMIVHPLLMRFRTRWGLSEADVAIVFIMGVTAAAVTGDGLSAFLLSNISAPYFGATPENRWLEYVGPHLQSWLIIPDDVNQSTWLFTGKPVFESIPWSAWIVPLIWWLSLFGATFIVCLSIVVLLRKQWTDNERLAFPLMEVPLELARGLRTSEAFWRKPAFWWGAIPPLFIVLFNMIGFFQQGWPEITNSFGKISFGKGFPTIALHFWYPIIGFAYFVNLDVLAGVWFFHLFASAETGIMNRVGYSSGTPDIYCSASHAVGWQGFGAMTFLVMGGIWMARRHLARTARSAVKKPRDDGGGDEMLTFRGAYIGLLAGTLYIAAWLWHSGMELPVVITFLFATFIMYVGLTRIVIQSGLVFVRAPMTAQSFTTSMLGSVNMSQAALTSVAVSFAWVHTVFFFMPAMAHAAKLHVDLRLDRRHVLIAIAIALIVATAVSIYVILVWGYELGGGSFHGYAFRGGMYNHYNSIVGQIRFPSSVDWSAMVQFGIGAALMWLLTLVMYRVPGWPIHPIGLTIGYTHPTAMIAFSIFIAWAAKGIILRMGGRPLYDRGKPFFLGLIIGYFTGLAIGVVVDWLYFGPGAGHGIYSL